MNLYANLHTHSTHSDGGYTPTQLARAAKAEGYGAIALTDHDTTTGYPEFSNACKELGLEVIFGTEFSSPSKLLPKLDGVRQEDNSFHIVGFDYDPEYPQMKAYLAELGARKTEQTRLLFERGVRLGLIKGINWDEVVALNSDKNWLSGTQLFGAMQAKGLVSEADRVPLSRDIFGIHRNEVAVQTVFKQEYEIIQLIRDAGGIPIVAHPHDQLQYIDALVEMGLQGLESLHGSMTEEEHHAALRIAYDKNLYISGGSDHRGLCSGYYERYEDPTQCPKYVPPLSLGTTKEHFEEIKNRKLNR